MDTTFISKCCKREAKEEGTIAYICTNCCKPCAVDEVCAQCLGSGEVSTDERDSDGNWQRGVGTEKCECQYE